MSQALSLDHLMHLILTVILFIAGVLVQMGMTRAISRPRINLVITRGLVGRRPISSHLYRGIMTAADACLPIFILTPAGALLGWASLPFQGKDATVSASRMRRIGSSPFYGRGKPQCAMFFHLASPPTPM